ncbi:FecR domain-containing protein, partial [bacterium]|nr:FecR domain-containing protein [bacterium]
DDNVKDDNVKDDAKNIKPVSDETISPEVEVVAKPKQEKEDVFDMQFKNLSKGIKKDKGKVAKAVKSEEKPLKLFILKKSRAKSFLEAFTVTVSFIIFSAIIFGASVLADISHNNYEQKSVHEGVSIVSENMGPVKQGQVIDTTGMNTVTNILIGQRGIVRLGDNTVVTLESIDNKSKTYTFNLKKGNLWGNSQFDQSSFVVKTDHSNLYAHNASFSVQLDDAKTDIYCDKHDVQVDLISDNEVINTLWIAQGNQAQILHSKIDSKKDTIKKLLYSKLVKEFHYGRLSEKKKKEDPWLSARLQNNVSDYNMFLTNYVTAINNKGLRTVSVGSIRSQAKSILADMQSALTFNQNKRDDHLLDMLFENIEDAQYLFLQGDDVDGNVRLSLFNSDISDVLLSSDENIKLKLFDRITKRYYELSLFSPGDDLFPIKKLMFEKLNDPSMSKFLVATDKFNFLTDKLNDVYEAVESSSSDLNESFAEYFDLYARYTKQYADKMNEIGDQIIHQNILVDNLLFQTPELYKLNFFDQKKNMEGDYLLALVSGADKKEQRQTFISNDIDLLSRIRYFLFKDRVDTNDAKQIVYRLIQDIEHYQEGTVDIAAVNELFDKRLADFGVFWKYLQATEYSSTQLHGASHSQRFEAFKKAQEQNISFNDIKNEILGEGKLSQESIDEIINRAKADLEDAGIQDVKFGLYTDASNNKIPILSARTSGIGFRATYDWDRQLLSNIIVNKIIISQDGVKLFKAKKFITETMASLSKAEEKQQISGPILTNKEELTDVKRVATVFLAEKFSKMDIVITMENVEVVDLDAGHYKVSDVYFKEQNDAIFSFEYSTGDDKVSNLTVRTKSGDKKRVNNTFPSMFLNDLVLKIYDESK